MDNRQERNPFKGNMLGEAYENLKPLPTQATEDDVKVNLIADLRVTADPKDKSEERKLLKQMAKVMYAVHRRLEFYTKREVESPSNHQEFAKEAGDDMTAFNLALSAYNEWTQRAAPSQPAGVSDDALAHTRSCPQLTPASDDECTCGLRWRIELQTEREMHNAWHKRAEEAEAALTAERQASGTAITNYVEALAMTNAQAVDLAQKLAAAESKWQTYERDYILPCFSWAKEAGIDLEATVRDNPGKNCVQLLVASLSKAAESTRDAAIVAMVGKCAATRCPNCAAKLPIEIDGVVARHWDTGEAGKIIYSPCWAGPIRAILPAETVAQVERERRKLQLEARIEEHVVACRQCNEANGKCERLKQLEGMRAALRSRTE